MNNFYKHYLWGFTHCAPEFYVLDLTDEYFQITNSIWDIDLFGSFGYAEMSLYDHHLSLSLSVLLSVLLSSLLLASVSVDSSPINFQNGCL